MIIEKTILCVDDDRDTGELLTLVFQNVGFEVVICHTPGEAICSARTNTYAAIITDFHLDGIDGTDLCRAIRTFDSITPIIFFSGEARPDKKQAALDSGAQVYITKPADFEKLEAIVTQLIKKSQSAVS